MALAKSKVEEYLKAFCTKLGIKAGMTNEQHANFMVFVMAKEGIITQDEAEATFEVVSAKGMLNTSQLRQVGEACGTLTKSEGRAEKTVKLATDLLS